MYTIVFRITLKKEFGGFAAVSNFIAKMEQKIELCPEEVRGVSSFLYKEDIKRNIRDLITLSYDNTEQFKEITKPENLIQGIKGYRVAYYIDIYEDAVEDVTELQYFILLKKFFSDILLGAFLEGTSNFYFIVSHYFYEINQSDAAIYNSIFYEKNQRLIRLQLLNVDKLKDFVPLIYIDEESYRKLKEPIECILDKDMLRKCMIGELNLDKLDEIPYIKGCLSLLSKTSAIMEINKIDSLWKELSEGSLFAFLIFSYTFEYCLKEKGTRGKKCDINSAIYFYRQIDECAVGCLQLVENIVLHAASGMGVLSIRFHSKKTEYIKKHYIGNMNAVPHLEVLVTDYSGGLKTENIADNFRNHVKNPELREEFQMLKPVYFIIDREKDNEEREEKAFEKYYSYSGNIGKHYGLKIFQNILKRNHGFFSFYSHQSGKCLPGESWNLKENSAGNNYAQCIPGTSFSALFPLEPRKKQINKFHLSLDENYALHNNIEDYYEYQRIDSDLEQLFVHFKTQDEKEEKIQKLSNFFLKYQGSTKEQKKVVYITARNLYEDFAEYICKALLVAGYKSPLLDFVFYHCSDEFFFLFLQTMSVYFEMGTMNYVYEQNEFSVVLFSEKPIRELRLIPQSIGKTFIANQLSGLSGDDVFLNDWLSDSDRKADSEGKEELYFPPYDVLNQDENGEITQTIFEDYVLQVLETDIQDRAFGCKISNTHMRLGSTIHIDTFYEAELLYSNWLFVSRFAYLQAQQIEKNADFQKFHKFTLYSYAVYSELFIFETMNILKKHYPDKSIDYAILEREAEHRGFNHIDRIRYSTFFETPLEQCEHFKDRKIICIVPINSTLKTHEKLIDLFCKENEGCSINNIILNFAVILVASNGQNDYWEIDEKQKTFFSVNLNIRPVPHYCVAIKVDYQEASDCPMCFPTNPLNETPLIEVNASSTIPDQSFGLNRNPSRKPDISWEQIQREEKNLAVLKNALIYSHVKRGENHFSFYFCTDRIFIENRDDIIGWMKGISDEMRIDMKEHHILVCPSHFSNAGFLEHINKVIFHGAAVIIRMDADKEYRCNMEAKYSHYQEFFHILSKREKESVIRLYYIDDSIITGRTYNRTKSLVSSILGIHENKYPKLKIVLFDRIFVLIDRNSKKSRMQYLEPVFQGEEEQIPFEKRFYAYRTLHISSVRSHGDSCVICQLVKKDKILHQTSVTKWMADYWNSECNRYQLHSLSDKSEERKLDNEYCNEAEQVRIESREDRKERAFRRMVSMHVANMLLSEECHGNQKEFAVTAILVLLLTDYEGRIQNSQEEAFEYLLSYLKVISRPFIAFSKAVREAIFDIILVFLEYLLNPDSNFFTKELKAHKLYLLQSKQLFERVNVEIIGKLTDNSRKKDLLLVLMKQCMELKGNYFIRPENIKKLVNFANNYSEEQQKDIYYKYLFLVKNLVGVNSDTSKSAWLNSRLSDQEDCMGLPKDIFTLLYLENVRAYYDGIDRLSNEDSQENDFLNAEIGKYQYRDFRLIIQKYDWLDEEGILKESEVSFMCSAIKLLKDTKKYIETSGSGEHVNIRFFCKKIVESIYGMTGAEKVYLGLEVPMECDIWEDDKKRELNELLPKDMEGLKFKLENKKEYLVIAGCKKKDKAEYSGKNVEMISIISKQEEEAIKRFRQDSFAMDCGFMLDEKNGYLIWEIGGKEQHSLFFLIKFDDFEYKRDLKLVRNIMAMNYLFQEKVFNQKTRISLYELMMAEKERILYNIDKMESHITVEIKNQQYSDVRSKDQRKEIYYKSYVLTLLKDLQVSDVYRPSLHRNYYCRYLDLDSFLWNDTAIILGENPTIFYVVGTTNYNYIELNVHTNKILVDGDQPLDAEDKLIGIERSDGVSTPFLLILALIMNAAVEGRSKSKPLENFDEIAKVDVYLSRTEGNELRILNFLDETNDALDQARSALEHPPGPDEGISLWSMSRFIRLIVSILLENCFIECKANLKKVESEQKKPILEKFRKKMEDLLSENYHMKIDTGKAEEQEYFSVSIPIFAKKYENYIKYFKRDIKF